MRVVIATLPGGDALGRLVAAWRAAGLAPDRLHVVIDARRVSRASLLAARLEPLGTYGTLDLWSLPLTDAAPDGRSAEEANRAAELVASATDARRPPSMASAPAVPERRSARHLRRRRRRRRAMTLLARLLGGGERLEWELHATALERGHGLGVARIGRDGEDAWTIARALLDCAHGAVRVVELDRSAVPP